MESLTFHQNIFSLAYIGEADSISWNGPTKEYFYKLLALLRETNEK